MIKTIFRILIILLITFALGWGSYLLIQSSPQVSTAGGFGGERPAFGDNEARTNPPQGFRGDDRGEFEGRGGFGAIGSIISILMHLFLFAVGTFLIVVLSKIIPKRPQKVEIDTL